MQNSVVNSSLSNNVVFDSTKLVQRGMLVQILVGIFLYVNCLMIYTFLKKEVFREETRYILFAQTLFVDSVLMVLSDTMVILYNSVYPIHTVVCVILCTVSSYLIVCTPLTLVAMCLERYVAICMPLRHADISTSRTRFLGLLIIWGISSISPWFSLIAYVSVAPSSVLFSYIVCSKELMLEKNWQAQAHSSILQFLFLIMIIIVAFTYIKIMIAARAALSENKKSTKKSLRTVILHAFQLLLCIMQFLDPYVEMVVLKIDKVAFVYLRYANFITFVLAPRCLSPLIYGLRDEKFFPALKHHAMCGLDSLFSRLSKVDQWKIRVRVRVIMK